MYSNSPDLQLHLPNHIERALLTFFNTLEPKQLGVLLKFNKSALLQLVVRESTPWKTMGHLKVRKLEDTDLGLL